MGFRAARSTACCGKSRKSSGITSRATLIAVGGYGRGEPSPHSDVDVLILPSINRRPKVDARTIENLVSLLWDLGVPPGSSVRTLDECLDEAQRDITILTASARVARADRRAIMLRRFSRAIVKSLDREAYFRAKLLEQQHRHIKYEEAPYSLEPNVKESPADCAICRSSCGWRVRAATAAAGPSSRAAGSSPTKRPASFGAASGCIKEIRARLHLVTGRREDRLVFDVQDAVAQMSSVHATANAVRAKC